MDLDLLVLVLDSEPIDLGLVIMDKDGQLLDGFWTHLVDLNCVDWGRADVDPTVKTQKSGNGHRSTHKLS